MLEVRSADQRRAHSCLHRRMHDIGNLVNAFLSEEGHNLTSMVVLDVDVTHLRGDTKKRVCQRTVQNAHPVGYLSRFFTQLHRT